MANRKLETMKWCEGHLRDYVPDGVGLIPQVYKDSLPLPASLSLLRPSSSSWTYRLRPYHLYVYASSKRFLASQFPGQPSYSFPPTSNHVFKHPHILSSFIENHPLYPHPRSNSTLGEPSKSPRRIRGILSAFTRIKQYLWS